MVVGSKVHGIDTEAWVAFIALRERYLELVIKHAKSKVEVVQHQTVVREHPCHAGSHNPTDGMLPCATHHFARIWIVLAVSYGRGLVVVGGAPAARGKLFLRHRGADREPVEVALGVKFGRERTICLHRLQVHACTNARASVVVDRTKITRGAGLRGRASHQGDDGGDDGGG